MMILFKENTANAQFYTLHAWIGICVFALYIIQWIGGFCIFLFPGPRMFSAKVRGAFHPFHTLIGALLYASALAAMLTGIIDRMWIYNAYNNPDVDLYGKQFVISNVLGLSIIFNAICIFSHFHPLLKPDDPFESVQTIETTPTENFRESRYSAQMAQYGTLE
mmetsp:Transcript_8333/g.12673  ORF Transcript_8333/g.12673 Transcript_8333/m.12673 type:complete len:163 (+) Transcript_8333:342-830(+)